MTVSTEVTELDGDRVRLDIAVPEAEVEQAIARTVRKIGRDVRVPGFRPGKVPARVVIQRVGRETVVQEMLRAELSEWYDEAIEESGVKPIDDPDVDLDEVPDDGDLKFSATVTTRPKAKLGDYEGIEVGKAEAEVLEGSYESELDKLRRLAGALTPIDRVAEPGDFVRIDFDGEASGKTLRAASAREHVVELGAGRLMPQFESALRGAKAGDERSVTVEYDRGDQRGELRGKGVEYTVRVAEVYEREMPEPTDAFAQRISEFDSMGELKVDIEERLQQAAESRVDELYRGHVIDAVVDKSKVDVPKQMIDDRVHQIVHATADRVGGQENLLQALTARGTDIGKWQAEIAPEAERAIARELVVEAAAEAAGIEVSDDEVESQIRDDAVSADHDPEELLASVRKEGAFEQLREDLRLRRAVDHLVAAAAPIPMATAEAREKLWTPESEVTTGDAGELWTPGDA